MNVEAIPASELSPDLIARWAQVQQNTPDLASPYFRPEYVQAAAELRNGIEIGLIRVSGEVVGFFPFERVQGSVARPVGDKLCDYQAVIAPAGAPWTVDAILAGCRLKAWEFDHQLASQLQLAPYFAVTEPSPLMDLSSGYEAYIEDRKLHTRSMNESLRKFRKFLREEEVRFTWHTTDENVLDQMMAWKSAQYARSGLADLFAVTWIKTFIRRLWQMQTPHFSGVLAAMHVGDTLVAAHFMLRSGPRLHSWFPAYDVHLAKRSPGMCLLLFTAQHAAEHGIDSIDLGKGSEDYKLQLASRSMMLGEGSIDTRVIASAMRTGLRRARDWVKQSPLKKPARASLRWLRSVQHWIGASRD